MRTTVSVPAPSSRRAAAGLAALLAALVALLLLGPVGTASAHDQLTGSEPADGETVDEAPDEVVLTFSGEIAELGAQVVVADPDGATVSEGDPEVVGTEVTQALVPDLPAGDYEVTWRVTSEDGHPISGTFGFTVAEGAGSPAEETTGEASAAETTQGAQETTDGASEEASDGETTAPETTDATPTPTGADETAGSDDASITAGPDASSEPGGLPVWAWVVVGLAALGLLALLVRTWTRGRE